MENEILKKFSNHEKLKFNEIKGKSNSSKLTYHIKKLLEKNYITKENESYSLTDKGEEALSYLSKKNQIKQPINDVFLLPYKNGKYVIQKRTKRPFLGTIIQIGARIRKGKSIFETAKEKLEEDTGLKGNLHYRGIIDVKTFKEKELLHHHILNVFFIDNLKGKLISSTKKGENFWMSEKEYYKQKNILTAAKEHFEVAKSKQFMLLELEQYLNKEGNFMKTKIIRKIKI